MGVVLIALGGAAGAVTRYLVDGWVSSRLSGAMPLGILLVNVSGSLAAGLLVGVAVERDLLPATLRAPLLVGFLGAYTTFSTLMVDSARLSEAGAVGTAVLNLVGSVVLGLVAVTVGLAIGRSLN